MGEFLDDDQLPEFGKPARVTVWPSQDALLQMGDIEVLLRIVEREGGFVVERRSRSAVWQGLLSTGWLQVARRYLLWEVGGWVRSAAEPRQVSAPTEPLRMGFDLIEYSPAQWQLCWREPAGARSAHFLEAQPQDRATRFARYADRPELAIVASFSTAGANAPTATQRELIAYGMQMMRRITPIDAELTGRALPDDDAVLVVHPVRGGGSLYVAPDRSVLFAASATPPHVALQEFRSGSRSPLERFAPDPSGPPRQT